MRYRFRLIVLLVLFLLSVPLTDLAVKHFQITQLTEPVYSTYTSDELSFLKTFYFMEHGMDYYNAFKSARAGLAKPDILNSDNFRWRMPTVFYLWTFFANTGEQILIIFIFLNLLVVYLIFRFLLDFTNLFGAVVGSGLYITYLFDSLAYQTAFLFMEWWGVIFLLLGLISFFYKRYFLATAGLLLACLIRELFIVSVLALLLLTLIKRDNLKPYLVSISLFTLVYAMHIFLINNQTSIIISDQSLFNRLHSYNFVNLQRMISFSMRKFIFFSTKTHYLILTLGLLSLTVSSFFYKIKDSQYLLVSVLSPILILPLISVYENDYWGITFVPFILISVPLVLKNNENRNLK